MIRSRTRSGTPGRPTPRRRRSSASLALATGGSFKIRWTVRCETRNCAAISLVECPASRRARTACRSSILSILLWPPLHENVGGRPKRRLQMPQDATEFREDRRQSLENPRSSQWAAIQSIAEKIGCSGETLRNWVRQAERDAGKRPGLTTTERERIKELERENRELRRANEILRKAAAFFAQAELDRKQR